MNALVAREIFGALFLTWRDQFVTVYDWLTPPGAIVLVFFFYKIDTNIERSYFLIFAINIHLIHQVYTNTKQPDRETDLSWPWYMLKASPQSYKVSSMTSFFFLLLWVPKRVATCGSVCMWENFQFIATEISFADGLERKQRTEENIVCQPDFDDAFSVVTLCVGQRIGRNNIIRRRRFFFNIFTTVHRSVGRSH